MDSDSLRPFEYTRVGDFYYTFTSRDGIPYNIYFIPLQDVYPEFINTYSFSIEAEDTRPHPIDRRIALTVVDILKHFFENDENAMVMVCDSHDGRQLKRRNLFDRWFNFYNDGTLDMVNASKCEKDYELFMTLYYKHTNPYKAQLLRAFHSLLSSDLYEIAL